MPESHTLSNSSGQVAGYNSGHRAFLWDSPSGSFTVLSNSYARATGINDAGQIVGESADLLFGQSYVFLWQNGEMQSLSLPCLGSSEGNYYISSSGQVAGACSSGDPRGFYWENGSVSLIEVRGREKLYITGLNKSGTVLGGYDGDQFYEHFVWRNGNTTLVTVPGATSYGSTHINDAGQVAGSYTDENGQSGGFIWQDENAITFGFGGGPTEIGTINTEGAVVGTMHDGTGKAQAFVWKTEMFLLETLAGEESSAVWINEAGLIVGQKGPIGQGLPVPCLWRNGQLLNLNDTLPAYLHWTLLSARQVTNAGDILAVASRDGINSLVMLRPLADTDEDGLPDEWEGENGLNKQYAADAEMDSDADGLTNTQEYHAGTHPTNPDTDGDGITDGWEIAYGYDPRDQGDFRNDPDGDGLDNLLEFQLGTNPNDADTDRDGLTDGQEVQYGTDPLNPDTDLDGMYDGWEAAYALDLFTNDSQLDPDNDGFLNLDEYHLGTDPRQADADEDGDGRPDLVDPWPTDYYDTDLPTLVVLSGANQAGITGTVLPEPIVVRVSDSYGQWLRNAPLLVAADPAGAAFSTSPAGPFNPNLSVRTGVDGTITIYVQSPNASMAFSVKITAVTVGLSRVVSVAAQSANVPSIAAGDYHTVVVGSSGMVWSWGLNSSGQLGDGTYLQRSLPSPVAGLSGVKTVVAGAYFTVALKSDGTVWAWGANGLGQLGNGAYVNSSLAVRVGSLTNIVAIAAGDNHSLALGADGTVYAWGFNSNGQLGEGTTNPRNQPVMVSGTGPGSGIIGIATGAYHSLALLTGGGVKGWGANFFGALGSNAGIQALSPTALPLSGVTVLAAGAYHTMAVKDSGTGEALGWNGEGQLGDGSTMNRSIPASVMNLSSLQSMAASKSYAGHCLALSQDGSVSTWGGNEYGQLGNQEMVIRTEPQDVSLPMEIGQVTAGGGHTVVLGANGTIFMWGNNQFGELGDGTTLSRLQPVQKVGLCLLPTALDTDQDALPDSWEMQHFGNLDRYSDSDPDEDGLKTLLEYQTARNPNVKDFVASAVTPITSQLIQMSSRATVGTGDNAIIAGFIVLGDAPKTLIIRALGPTLGQFQVPGFLQDPKLELFNQGALLATNDNWQDDPDQAALLLGYNLAPGFNSESALVIAVQPGAYTAVVTGVGNTTGIAILEIYDVDQSDSNLANLSARARLSSGDNVLIAGFIVDGAQPLKTLVRVTGPSLALFGISDPLPDPIIQLRNAANELIDQNDNWEDSPDRDAVLASGLAPLNSLEPALVENLPPGLYTAVVDNSAGTSESGIAVVEVYALDAGHDSDQDGLTDWEETNVYHTNPNDSDTDNDGMDDGWEIHHGLNPLNAADGGSDLDGDGRTNRQEYDAGTDPTHFDLPSGTEVGTTQGKLSIDNSGGASYSIPIVVAPGTAGMQPKLSFEYSTRAGNGLLGVGWSIGGLSAITRSPATIAQDGFVHGVNFTTDDRFSIDGQRLIAVSGAYGANGTEYRTEIDSFSKIVSHTEGGLNGPRRFTVTTKSGLTYTYGEENDSRFIAQGRSDQAVLSWALSKITDTSNNYILFRYFQDQANGEYRPLRIEYTNRVGDDPPAPYAFVDFIYEIDGNPLLERPDKSIGYVAGSKVRQRTRLSAVRSSVTTEYGTQLVREYALSYSFHPVSLRSRLEYIQERGANASLRPTVFTWRTDTENDVLVRSNFHPTTVGNTETQRWMPGDFSGDGRSDMASVTKVGGNQKIEVHVAQPSAPGAMTVFQSSTWRQQTGTFDEDDSWLGGDYNGDGKLDIIRLYTNPSDDDQPATLNFYQNNIVNNVGAFLPAAICPITSSPVFALPPDRVVYPADMDGDGKLDLVVMYGHSGVKITVLLNTGNNGQGVPQFHAQTWYTYSGSNALRFDQTLDWFIGDLTGDGLPDLMWIKNNGGDRCDGFAFVNRPNGSQRSFGSGLPPQWVFPQDDPDVHHAIWFSGDFNGDGLLDLGRLQRAATPIFVYVSTGKAFLEQDWGFAPHTVASNTAARGGDFNGDGRTDIGIIYKSNDPPEPPEGEGPEPTPPPTTATYTQVTIHSNGINGFTAGSENDLYQQLNSYPLVTLDWLPADFNGDGKEDFARSFKSSGGLGVHVFTGTSGVQDLFESVTDGMGSRSSVTFRPLIDSSVYLGNTPFLVDAIDLAVPIPVVSQVQYDDGLAADYTVSYKYGGLKASPKRGILGFRTVISKDDRTGIQSIATLRQTFPYTGMAELLESYQQNGRRLSRVATTHYDHKTHNDTVHFVYSQDSVAESFDLLDESLTSKTRTTVSEVDNYGNTKNIVVTSSDDFIKTTTNNYDLSAENLANWRIGKLMNSSVTHRAPDQPLITRTSGFTYAGNGQIGSEIIEPGAPLSATTSYVYDDFGNTRVTTTSGADIESRTATTYYDPHARFATMAVNGLGHVETREYDERWGLTTLVTGPNGLSTRTVYDDFGRKRLETLADGSRTIITYNETNDGDIHKPDHAVYYVSTVSVGTNINDRSAIVVAYFDRLGRELRKVTTGGVEDNGQSRVIVVDTTYNALGQAEYVTRPYFFNETPLTIQTKYDLLARVEWVKTPKEGGGMAVTSNAYHGLIVESQNPLQQGTNLKTTTRRDTQGRVVEITDALQGSITFTYDAVGNLIKSRDAAGNLTHIKYDDRGRKTRMDDPDLGVWYYDYNSIGELVYQRDANGNITTMEYDKLGRMKKRIEPAGVGEWIYDNDEAPGRGIGKLHTATFTSSESGVPPFVRTMTYDNFGRLTHQTERIDDVNYSFGTTYDSLSRIATISYPTGFAVRNTYDINGYLQQVGRSDAGGPVYWKAERYDAVGHITRQRAGNNVVTDRVYVAATGMLSEIHSALNGTGSAVQNLGYHFDDIGNLVLRADYNQFAQGGSGGSGGPGGLAEVDDTGMLLQESFEYDELNRLRFAHPLGRDSIEVRYNSIGNITFKSDVGVYSYVPGVAGGSDVPSSPGAVPHPHAVRRAGNLPEAHYDANGNMTIGMGRTTTWTSFNMPKLITRGNASSLFSYDSEHNRIKQLAQKNGAVTTTTYVGGMYEIVDDPTKIARKHYISSPAGRIALYTEEFPHTVPYQPDAVAPSSRTDYFHKDHLDSIDTISNHLGAVIERDSFDAWGARRETDWHPGTEPIHSMVNRGFTGHEQLDDLGLVHMNGRIYDPLIGRFLSADPFIQAPTETQNYNRYSYVLNNPTSMTDPSGFNFLGNFGRWLTKTFGAQGAQIVMGVLAVAAGIATAGIASYAYIAVVGYGALCGTGMTGLVVAGAGFGFGSAFVGSALSGASLGESLQAAAIGAVIGGISAGVAKGLGDLNLAGEFFSWGHGGQTLGHALLGGVTSEIQGGNFQAGALAGGITAALGPAIDMIGVGSGSFEAVSTRVVAAAALGGTAAQLGGGKFANGAVTAAFLRLYNHEVHRIKQQAAAEAKARQVNIYYDRKKGWVWIGNYRTGESITLRAFSGHLPDETLNGGPIPAGTYSIVTSPEGNGHYLFALFMHDGNVNDEMYFGETRRFGFRFHEETLGSDGCITFPRGQDFNRAASIIYSATDTRSLRWTQGGEWTSSRSWGKVFVGG